MPDFMSSDNDSAEATGVLDDGHAVDLLQTFVHHASTSHVSKACGVDARATQDGVEVTKDSLINFLIRVE